MSDPDRPPLDPILWEQIKMLLDRVDQRHWPSIAAWRVPNYFPPGTPVPSQYPLHFLNSLQVYASMLLKNEADQYGQFRAHERYEYWLSKLTGRILERVVNAVDAIEQTDNKATLWYHGANRRDVEQAVLKILWELTHPYTGGIANSPTPVQSPKTGSPTVHEPPAPEISVAAPPSDRNVLRDLYLAKFPDAKIRDICWAAQQHYREWRRWLKGEIKDGLKPDRAFRRVLTSGKSPEELVRKPRPPKWE